MILSPTTDWLLCQVRKGMFPSAIRGARSSTTKGELIELKAAEG